MALLSKINDCYYMRETQTNQTSNPAYSQASTNLPIKTPIKMGTKNKENQSSIRDKEKNRTIKNNNKVKKIGNSGSSTSFKNLINLKMKKSVLSSIEYREESFELGEKDAFR